MVRRVSGPGVWGSPPRLKSRREVELPEPALLGPVQRVDVVDLGGGVVTPSSIPAEVRPIFRSRLDVVEQLVDRHFGDRFRSIRCIDVGCHEGFYSVAMARRGARHVLGVDVREDNLARARFVAETLNLRNIRYERCNCEDISPDAQGRFELTLLLGLLYHLENPMLCLRRVAAVERGSRLDTL